MVLIPVSPRLLPQANRKGGFPAERGVSGSEPVPAEMFSCFFLPPL